MLVLDYLLKFWLLKLGTAVIVSTLPLIERTSIVHELTEAIIVICTYEFIDKFLLQSANCFEFSTLPKYRALYSTIL